MIDFTALMGTAQKQHWALVALDVAVDTFTPTGEATANMLATFAQFERRLIGQRTKEALAVKKANGVRLGRPSAVPSRWCGGSSGSAPATIRCMRSPTALTGQR
jgi:DNA invertase Pin-like site-specific DNA recombinase